MFLKPAELFSFATACVMLAFAVVLFSQKEYNKAFGSLSTALWAFLFTFKK
jgi:hypothetical protein